MPRILLVTTSSKAEALKIGRMLVQEKLAICINSWEGVDSVYWWRDKIEEASEAVLLVKCEDGMGAHVSARIKELHSYESPSIIEL